MPVANITNEQTLTLPYFRHNHKRVNDCSHMEQRHAPLAMNRRNEMMLNRAHSPYAGVTLMVAALVADGVFVDRWPSAPAAPKDNADASTHLADIFIPLEPVGGVTVALGEPASWLGDAATTNEA